MWKTPFLPKSAGWGMMHCWYANCSLITKSVTMSKDKYNPKRDQAPDLRDGDELAAGVPVRHPNRNTDKWTSRSRDQRDTQEGRTSDESSITEPHSSLQPEELSRIMTKESFAELANHKDHPCISLYLPTHSAGAEVNTLADQNAFKQALNEIRIELKSKSDKDADRLLEPAHALLGDSGFWRGMSKGLALFICNDRFRYMKLPFAPEKQVLVNSSFLITPLIPLMTSKEYFYLLVISKKQVKLFKADAFGMEYIDVPNLPQGGVEEGLGYDKDVATTFRAGGRGGSGGANFHGAGGGNNNDDKVEVATYLEAADDIIWKEVLHNENVPLLLAGVEYLIPIYRSVSDYNHVYEDAITGNHERDDMQALYEMAIEKMVPYFQQRTHKALDLYGNQSATALTTSITDDIIPAAYYGQISHLFVQKGAHIWGTFDETNNQLQTHDTQREGGEDLLDCSVSKTLLNGGDVFVLDKEMMPADSVLAAVLRY